MRRRNRLAIAVTLATTLAFGLSSCAATPAIEEATAGRLQQAVLSVTESAADGDLAGASAALDRVVSELEAAKVRGEVTEDRYARILMAIDAVRARLTADTAPASPTPAPASPDVDEATEEEPPPAEAPPATTPPEDEPDDGGEDGGTDDGSGDPTPQPTPPTTTAPPTPTPSTAPTTPAPKAAVAAG